ncbi:monovalent cation:proton antiporter family protein [Lactobacillus psittaci]|uniref:Na+-H+ antiporter n=1 Tax=Lactobacillus psittaci DSM 15354 TaxID=1122152 RepID=A0A0R1S6F4_9LACO|nr:cation:proton antiporter family protein [Lactobacillus psittaci]KRL62037.1 Na+-H+ antiporter [Lactobacillus psittaci DSM 15354]
MFIIILMALVIPILMARLNLKTIPTAVAEIVVGIILGVSGLNWVETSNTQLTFMSTLGVLMLMFLSGMEINFELFKKSSDQEESIKPLPIAVKAFSLVAITSVILSLILRFLGIFTDTLLAIIIFMTVALGVVIATLKEKEILSKPIGQTILLTAVLGEVIPLLGLTIYASVNGGDAEKLWLIILLFGAAIFLLNRFKAPYRWFNQVTKQTTQIDIRLAFFLIFTLVSIAEKVGAENILGAFLAGIVMKLLKPSEATMDKLTSIGYGFFIPFFFMMTGAKLNLKSLFANPKALALVPVLIICFFLAKMPAWLVFSRHFKGKNAVAATVLPVTTITIVLPALQVATKLKTINSTQADAFTLAAIIICLLAPVLFNSLFKLSPEDQIKEKVTFIGANLFTVATAQDLHEKWYSVDVLTTEQADFDTYKSKVNLRLVTDYLQEKLGKIVVVATRDDQANYELALKLKESGVKRIIVYLRQPEAVQVKKLTAEKIEVFNSYHVRNAAMRVLIETPGFYDILTSTDAILYDVEIKNHRYAGIKLMDLDFTKDITISRIRRNGAWLIPHGETILEVGDEIVYSGKIEAADEVRERLSKNN